MSQGEGAEAPAPAPRTPRIAPPPPTADAVLRAALKALEGRAVKLDGGRKGTVLAATLRGEVSLGVKRDDGVIVAVGAGKATLEG